MERLIAILDYTRVVEGEPGKPISQNALSRLTEGADGVKVDPGVFNRIYRTPSIPNEEDWQKIDDISYWRMAPALWLPFSVGTDPVTGESLEGLHPSFAELRAIGEGTIPIKVAEAEEEPPFQTAIEAERHRREHSYLELCETCGLGSTTKDVERIRRLIQYGGISGDVDASAGDLVGIGLFYLNSVERAIELQRESIHMARESCHCH